MKKIILYITILMFAVVQIANSQTATLQTKDGTYGTTKVNVSFSGFSSTVGAITMKIGFDPNVATFTGVDYGTITSGIIANAVGNEIVVAWSNVPGSSVNGIGFKLNFIYTGGSCALTFNQGCEIADGGGNVIQATLLNGAINQPSLSTTATIGSQNGDYSQVNELPLTFSGFPITPADALVGAISLNIAYDNTKIQFVGIDGLSGAITNAGNGIISIQWSNSTPIDINSLNLKLRFNYLGGYSAVTFSGVNIISNSNGVQIPVSLMNGSINQPPTSASVDLGDDNGDLSGNTVIPVNFSGFPFNPAAFTLNIAYDNTVANFIGTSGLTGLTANASNGIITLAWSNQNGVAINSFDLLFNYVGGSSTLNFTGQNEISNANGATIPVTYTGGNINQPPTPVNVSLGNVSFTPGNPVLVPLEFAGVTGNINSATMFVGFDQTKLTYLGAENLSKSGIIVNQDNSTGKILINWADANAANTIVNGKFLDLKFSFTGGVGNTNVSVYFTTFNSASGSLSDDLGNTVLVNWANGNVNYVPPITTFNVTGGGSYCAGGSGKTIDLDGSQSGVNYQLKLNGSNTGGTVAGTGSTINFGLQTAAGTYTVDATMGSTTLSMAGNAIISINAIPTVSTASVSPTSVCGSGTVAFSATASEGNIVWYDALTGGNVVTPPSTISTTTTIYAEAVSTQNCISAARTQVVATVNTVPIVSTASVTPTSVCGSGNVAFSATPSSGNIVWYDALTGGNVVTPPTAISTTTTLYAEALSTQSCISAARTQVVATVNTIPTVSTASVTPTSVCGTGNVAFSAVASEGTIKWFTLSSGGVEVTPPTTISTTTTLYAEALSTQNCISAARTQVIATVNIVPSVLSTTVSPSALCGSGVVTFGGAASSGDINWYDDPFAGNLVTVLNPNISTTTTYYAEAVSPQGCISANRIGRTATVNDLPTAFISGDATINNGNSATLTLTVTGSGTISGTLSNGASFTGTAPTITVSVSPSLSTVYTITSLSDEHCTASVVGLSGSANISVLYKVSGYLRYNNNANTALNNSTVFLQTVPAYTDFATTTTNASGYYEFYVPNGSYRLNASTTKAYGGLQTLDATLVSRKFGGIALPGENCLRIQAADVNLSGAIQTLDATLISRRFGGNLVGYRAPNWIFGDINISFTSLTSNNFNTFLPIISVNNANASQNLWGLCSGDVNGSYTPPAVP